MATVAGEEATSLRHLTALERCAGMLACEAAPDLAKCHVGMSLAVWNASTQTIGLGGEFIYRPSPWEAQFKVNYALNEAKGQLRAQALLLSFRAPRPIRPRLAGYGQYGYQRDRFAGILDRDALEAGLEYLWLQDAPQKLVLARACCGRSAPRSPPCEPIFGSTPCASSN